MLTSLAQPEGGREFPTLYILKRLHEMFGLFGLAPLAANNGCVGKSAGGFKGGFEFLEKTRVTIRIFRKRVTGILSGDLHFFGEVKLNRFIQIAVNQMMGGNLHIEVGKSDII